jgi:membrane protein YdbS with pleckstrin-like domain
MSVGVGILLLVIGAIFAFAIDVDLHWLNVTAIGAILMLAGVVELVITLLVWNRRRHQTAVTQREVYRGGEPTVVTERRSVNDADPGQRGPGGSIRAPGPERRT